MRRAVTILTPRSVFRYNGTFPSGGSGYASMPNKMIAYEIAKHFLLIIFDEYGTSKNCPIPTCDGLMVDKSRTGGNRVRICTVCGLECERDTSSCQSGVGILSATTSGRKRSGKVKVNSDLWVEKFRRRSNGKNSKSSAESEKTKKRKTGGVTVQQAKKEEKKKKKKTGDVLEEQDFEKENQGENVTVGVPYYDTDAFDRESEEQWKRFTEKKKRKKKKKSSKV